MTFGCKGMKPDPVKVDVLKFITQSSNKEYLVVVNFLCIIRAFSRNLG